MGSGGTLTRKMSTCSSISFYLNSGCAKVASPSRALGGGSTSSAPKSKLMSFTALDRVLLAWTASCFLADVGSDIWLAIRYARDGLPTYCALTVACILIPSVCASVYSFICYREDDRKMPANKLVVARSWTLRSVFLVLQLGPLLRMYSICRYGCLSNQFALTDGRKRKIYEQLMHEEMLDASKLQLFDTFMEAGSQLLLQLYILSANDFADTRPEQIVAIMITFVAMAWSVLGYQRNIRKTVHGKNIIPVKSWPIYLLWCMCLFVARTLAIALFASACVTYLSVFMLFHWSIMFHWIRTKEQNFCGNSTLLENLYNAVLSYFMIFIYFNFEDTPTRFRMVFYYVLTAVENVVLLGVWAHFTSLDATWCAILLGIHYSTFILGLLLMVCYYYWFHPRGDIPLWRGYPDVSLLKQMFLGSVDAQQAPKQPDDNVQNCTDPRAIEAKEEDVIHRGAPDGKDSELEESLSASEVADHESRMTLLPQPSTRGYEICTTHSETQV